MRSACQIESTMPPRKYKLCEIRIVLCNSNSNFHPHSSWQPHLARCSMGATSRVNCDGLNQVQQIHLHKHTQQNYERRIELASYFATQNIKFYSYSSWQPHLVQCSMGATSRVNCDGLNQVQQIHLHKHTQQNYERRIELASYFTTKNKKNHPYSSTPFGF